MNHFELAVFSEPVPSDFEDNEPKRDMKIEK